MMMTHKVRLTVISSLALYIYLISRHNRNSIVPYSKEHDKRIKGLRVSRIDFLVYVVDEQKNN